MQRSWKRALLLCGLALGFAACNSNIDDPDGPSVELEVQTLQNSSVTAANQQQGGGGGAGGCLRTVTQWSVGLTAVPKNSLAGTPPFNDVIMETVDVSYTWFEPAIPPTPDRTFGLGSVAIPAAGTNTVLFFPITTADLDSIPLSGGTASVRLVFRGQQVEGTDVSLVAQSELFVEPCPPTP